MDSGDFNSVNMPIKNGLSILKTKSILDTIYNNCDINSMNIVKINYLMIMKL